MDSHVEKPDVEIAITEYLENKCTEPSISVKKSRTKSELIDLYFEKCGDLGIIPPQTKGKLTHINKPEIQYLIDHLDVEPDSDDEEEIVENDEKKTDKTNTTETPKKKKKKFKLTAKGRKQAGKMLFDMNVWAAEFVESGSRSLDPQHDFVDFRGLSFDYDANEEKFIDIYSECADDYPLLARYITHWGGKAVMANMNLMRKRNKKNAKFTEEEAKKKTLASSQ